MKSGWRVKAHLPFVARDVELRPFVHRLGTEIVKDHVFDIAAELAFWSLLATFPFLIMVLTIIGYLPLHGASEELTATLYRVMPQQAAALVDHTLHEVVGRARGGLLVVSMLGALWSASGGIGAAMTALNRAYDVPDRNSYLRAKARSLVVTLAAAALSVLAAFLVLVGPAIGHLLARWWGLGPAVRVVWQVARWTVAVLSMQLVLALLYYFLPNVKNNRFRFITPGAVVAVFGWLVVSALFNLYVSHFSVYAKTYGTLGAAVVLLLWLYLTGFMIVLGGEINAILDRHVLGQAHEPRDEVPLLERLRGWGRRRGMSSSAPQPSA